MLNRIQELIDEEHRLRGRLQQHQTDPHAEQQRLTSLQAQLDQCWDLLRQRRALRDAGADPGEATVRSAEEVEGYLS